MMDVLEKAACYTDRDRALKTLEGQFNAIAAEMLAYERAYLARVAAEQRAGTRDTDSQLNSLLVELESILDRMDPIGRAILATMPSTVEGLAIQARYAAFLLSHYWDEPVDKMELHKKAIRILIEHVCRLAEVPFPFASRRE
jgi:hypothetical protein